MGIVKILPYNLKFTPNCSYLYALVRTSQLDRVPCDVLADLLDGILNGGLLILLVCINTLQGVLSNHALRLLGLEGARIKAHLNILVVLPLSGVHNGFKQGHLLVVWHLGRHVKLEVLHGLVALAGVFVRQVGQHFVEALFLLFYFLGADVEVARLQVDCLLGELFDVLVDRAQTPAAGGLDLAPMRQQEQVPGDLDGPGDASVLLWGQVGPPPALD